MTEVLLSEVARASAIHGAVTLVTTIGLVANWYSNRQVPGVGYFAMAGTGNVVGFTLLIVHEITPVYLIAAASEAALIFALLSAWFGLRLFLSRPMKWQKSLLVAQPVNLVIMGLFPFFMEQYNHHIYTYTGIVSSLLILFILGELLKPALSFRAVRWTMAFISAVLLGLLVYRTGYLALHPTADLGLFDQLFYLFLTLYVVATSMGAIYLTTEKLQSELKRQVDRDPLTNAYNRRAFRRIMAALHCRVRQTQDTATLLCIDLDHFKSVNDRFGHAAGDHVLIEVTHAIENCIRSEDMLARTGGEEFIVILEHSTFREARAIAERVLEAISSLRFHFDNATLQITTSIGMTPYLDEYASVDKAMDAADHALYEAKRLGRNRIVVAASNNKFKEVS